MATATNENNLTEDPAGTETPPATEKPRGRGRPKGSTTKTNTDDKPEIETILEGQGGASTEVPKPQQKKRGPKGGGKSDIQAMANQLVGVHQLVAMVTGLGALQISMPEGEQLATAISNVCEEYGLSISGKTGAALQLFAAAAMIYGPRAFIISQQVAAARAEQARDVSPPAH